MHKQVHTGVLNGEHAPEWNVELCYFLNVKTWGALFSSDLSRYLLHLSEKGTVAIFAAVPFLKFFQSLIAMISLRNFLKLTVVQFRIETAF